MQITKPFVQSFTDCNLCWLSWLQADVALVSLLFKLLELLVSYRAISRSATCIYTSVNHF